MIRPDEAILIIKSWLENKTDLLLSASMINFSVYSKCRVADIRPGLITLWSLDTNFAVFSFDVEHPDLSLTYSRAREYAARLPGLTEQQLDRSALVISIPVGFVMPEFTGLDRSVEKIVLMEFLG